MRIRIPLSHFLPLMGKSGKVVKLHSAIPLFPPHPLGVGKWENETFIFVAPVLEALPLSQKVVESGMMFFLYHGEENFCRDFYNL